MDVVRLAELHGRYVYEPLEQGSIRLLVLLEADDFQDDLEGGLVHIPLNAIYSDENPYPYVALSYVWGRTGRKVEMVKMYFDDKVLHVGKNLDSALRHMRRKDRAVFLWVDAICIDQSNVQERNHQVQQMRDIYSSARETVIYIGDQTGDNTGLSAWNFLERRAKWALNNNGDPDYNRPREMEDLIDFRGTLDDVHLDVLSRPWFGRVWVLQEVVVSRYVSIQCGRRCVPWDDFCRTIMLKEQVHDQYGHSLRRESSFEVVQLMFQLRAGFHLRTKNYGANYLPPWYEQVVQQNGASTDILDTLRRASGFLASDPRDKIIALLGITTGFDWLSHETADYNMTSVDVYTKFARDHLAEHGDCQLLEVQELATERRNQDLPSWVPDWSIRMRMEGKSLSSMFEREDCSIAELRQSKANRWKTWVGGGSIMAIRGRIMGIVTSTQPVHLWGHEELMFNELSARWEERNSEMGNKDPDSEDAEWEMVEVEEAKGLNGEMSMKEPPLPFPIESYILSVWADLFDTAPGERTPRSVQRSGGAHWLSGSRLDDYLARGPGTRSTNSNQDGWPYSLPEQSTGFLSHMDMTGPPVPNSIEDHLVKRAKTTVTWSDTRYPASRPVTNKDSVIDGRSIGLFKPYPDMEPASGLEVQHPAAEEAKAAFKMNRPHAWSFDRYLYDGPKQKLVLLPRKAEVGDLVVHFPGARIPFVLRAKKREVEPEDGAMGPKSLFPSREAFDQAFENLRGDGQDGGYFWSYHHVGGCWINEYDETVKGIDKLDHVFLIR
ncbi:hypothetical protein MKZ38_002309 [Zalerion maritima]|uniref:Heterokaryon incompatibility domain-containing protein n=1 Tax=Zalerion maritima TaxID=339359 RepID=A0AAD5RP23_9PEZI|nr:hypothetical protein MKZ38_002309 [Zalerion maritima]